MNIAQIDPFLYGYFLDDTLEHGERVGLALLYAAKNIEISSTVYFCGFNQNIRYLLHKLLQKEVQHLWLFPRFRM